MCFSQVINYSSQDNVGTGWFSWSTVPRLQNALFINESLELGELYTWGFNLTKKVEKILASSPPY